jgi:hypothetical protein
LIPATHYFRLKAAQCSEPADSVGADLLLAFPGNSLLALSNALQSGWSITVEE